MQYANIYLHVPFNVQMFVRPTVASHMMFILLGCIITKIAKRNKAFVAIVMHPLTTSYNKHHGLNVTEDHRYYFDMFELTSPSVLRMVE